MATTAAKILQHYGQRIGVAHPPYHRYQLSSDTLLFELVPQVPNSKYLQEINGPRELTLISTSPRVRRAVAVLGAHHLVACHGLASWK
jgi:hypothetical protein